MWWMATASADGLSPLPHAGEVPELRWYGQVSEVGGLVVGRWRRRKDGEHELSVLPDGSVVRWWHRTAQAEEDHQRDAAGRAWATTRWVAGSPVAVTLHGPTDEPIDVAGWSWTALPGGGAVWTPSGASSTDDGAAGPLLGGRWTASLRTATDPTAPAFGEGLLDGCRCALVDRGTAWLDGRPAVRHALRVPAPGALPGDPGDTFVEVWAAPVAGGLLVLTWTLGGAPDLAAAARAARVLPALVDLDRGGAG